MGGGESRRKEVVRTTTSGPTTEGPRVGSRTKVSYVPFTGRPNSPTPKVKEEWSSILRPSSMVFNVGNDTVGLDEESFRQGLLFEELRKLDRKTQKGKEVGNTPWSSLIERILGVDGGGGVPSVRCCTPKLLSPRKGVMRGVSVTGTYSV